MSLEKFPLFRYHPDPVATGSVVRRRIECVCCGAERDYVYVGPVYSAADLDKRLCPWCIADGSAAEKFEAEFVDPDAVGDYGRLDPVPDSVRDEVSQRTPGFTGWQVETWSTHCGDAAAYIGTVGKPELDAIGAEAWAAVMEATGFHGEEWEQFASSVRRNGETTVYLFRCLHCGQLGATWDCA